MNVHSQSSSGGGSLEVLVALLNAGAVTAETLESCIREHPDLLRPETQTLLSILADAQGTPEARAQVKRLERILTRLRTESVHAVLSDEANRARRQAARRAREVRLRSAREKFLSWRGEARAESPAPAPDRRLKSLSEVVASLRSISAAERPRPYGRNVLAAQPEDDPVPAYLFRGESGRFPETYSSMARLRSKISRRAIEDVTRICDLLVAAFGAQWAQTRQQALGFLQHYGYPTDLIDVTSDASVAASFASSLRVGDEGAVCIVPTDELKARGSLIDLRHHPLARRPRKQSAFAVHLPEYPDLKAPEAIKELRLTWIPFRMTQVDAARFVPDFELLDARSDKVAGLIWLMIDDCGKFSDEAASLLANRIDPAPVFAVTGSDGKAVIVSEDEVSPENPVSDDQFRHSQYTLWSDKFAPIERKPLPPELERALSTGPPEPGSVLRIFTTRFFGGGEEGGR